MLEKVKDILGMENGEVNIPRHIGISTSGIELWAKENGKGLDEANKKSFANMLIVLREQMRLKIPYVTIYLMREDMDKEGSHFKVLVDSIVEFFSMLKDLEEIHSNKVKVSI